MTVPVGSSVIGRYIAASDQGVHVKFGLFLMPEPFPWSNWTLSYDLKLEEIAYAERFGYDEVWVGEHHTGAYENIPAPDIFIAKASALTSRIAPRHRHHQPAVPRPVHGRRAPRVPRPPHATAASSTASAAAGW